MMAGKASLAVEHSVSHGQLQQLVVAGRAWLQVAGAQLPLPGRGTSTQEAS
jgi:hypothetical protein